MWLDTNAGKYLSAPVPKADMGDPACYLHFCPECHLPLSTVDETCPDCGAQLQPRAEVGTEESEAPGVSEDAAG